MSGVRIPVQRDEPLYKYAIETMEANWGITGRYPGCQPISIEYKHFDTLKKYDYVVCEKTDGVRYMMIALTFEGKKVCVFINRALDMFKCPINFKKSVYNLTIVEGELYDDHFMIYDILTSCGIIVGHHDFLERLQQCEDLMAKAITMKNDTVKLKVKTFHILKDYEQFLNEYLPTVSQEIDGLIFTPVHCPIKTGTHEYMFKWKPLHKNTIDFQLKYEHGKWRMYVQEKGNLIFESEIPPDKNFDYSLLQENAIVECEYKPNDTPMWWKPLMLRPDKTYPNSRKTFYRTLVNIKEDIDIKDFLKCT